MSYSVISELDSYVLVSRTVVLKQLGRHPHSFWVWHPHTCPLRDSNYIHTDHNQQYVASPKFFIFDPDLLLNLYWYYPNSQVSSLLAHHSTGFQKQFGNELVDVLPAPELAIWDLQDYRKSIADVLEINCAWRWLYRSKTGHCILQTWLWLSRYGYQGNWFNILYVTQPTHVLEWLPVPPQWHYFSSISINTLTAPLNINTSRSALTVKIIQIQKHNAKQNQTLSVCLSI